MNQLSIEQFEEIFNSIKDLHIAKNKDYGSAVNLITHFPVLIIVPLP